MSVSTGLVATAVGSFVATNVDGLAVTLPLIHTRRPGTLVRVLSGQLCGYSVLLVLSALLAVGLSTVPPGWSRLAGLVPIFLGVRALFRHKSTAGERRARAKDGESRRGLAGFHTATALTLATGFDNVAVLGPLFRLAGAGGSAAVASIHLTLLAACSLAMAVLSAVTRRRVTPRVPGRLVPCLFIVIGAKLLAG